MKYILKSSVLYREDTPAARIGRRLSTAERDIYVPEGMRIMHAHITDSAENTGDVRSRRYILEDLRDHTLIEAVPGYAREEDPEIYGWPLSHMPRCDHADLVITGRPYRLVMLNSQNYVLYGEDERAAVQIVHRGISGGWNIEADRLFSPALLCGLFVFCRYIESENEFPVV